MPILHCLSCHHEWEGRANSMCAWCGAGSCVLAEQSELERMVASRSKKPGYERKAGKSRLRVCYSWATRADQNTLHLFMHLSGQTFGKAMCGTVIFSDSYPLDRPRVLGCDVCDGCRHRGLGHPLPRGLV